mgnify:CR=1 FL=1
MGRKRDRYGEALKTKVAVDALQGIRTLSELSGHYKIHSSVIARWKKQLLAGAAEIFRGEGKIARSEEELTAPLYEEIGRLKVELDWLKKKLEISPRR